MKSTEKHHIRQIFFLGVLLIIIAGSIQNSGTNNNTNNKYEQDIIGDINPSGFWERTWIHIDANWTDTNSIYDWCSGSGTWSDPYIIENVSIDGGGSGSCILIENSNDYFIIRNCTIYNSGTSGNDAGISLVNLSYGSLIKNNCSFNNNGIFLNNAVENTTISQNIISNNSLVGIFFTQDYLTPPVQNNLIYNNTFIGNNFNALDNGTNNVWNTTEMGNYWDDYAGVDADDNGIGDTSYLIFGNAGSYDYRPIWDDGPDIQIEIITPENKTYTEPMSGYYPATYGFECDELWAYPSGFTINEGTGAAILVNISETNHERIVLVYDGDGAGNGYITNNFSPQNSGTVEFWIKSSDVTMESVINLRDGVSTIGVDIALDNEYLRYFDGIWHDIASVSDYTWYHIRIDFECSSGAYQGLSEDTFYIYLNETQYGPYNFENPITSVNEFYLRSGSLSDSDLYTYFDALGYSWDSNYAIGDNLDEGILLSFQNNTEFNLLFYSLDGGPNVTINGNTTLKAPSNDYHTVQVFGNETSSGTIYNSDIRYFEIANEDITGPSITINNPTANDLFGLTVPNYVITIGDPSGLDTTWYTIDGGATNYTFISNGSINSAAWSAQANGTVIIRFYANDSLGNLAWEQVIVRKDIIGPTINSGNISPDSGSIGAYFTITINISDSSGIFNASAQIQCPDENTLFTLQLYDDGTNSDVTPGDGTYTCLWDSAGQSEGTYYVDVIGEDNALNSN